MFVIFVSMGYQDLYNGYKKTLQLEGECYFRKNVLAPLREEEKDGAVISTGVMDENTSIRRSAIPVELRRSAAEGVLLDHMNGTDENAGGLRVSSINRACDFTEL